MECPICFTEYDTQERRPLRAFCACQKTICLSCVESMLKNAAFCPWDKTRWIGRNLMAKFQSNTPDNYLKILLKEAVSNQTNEILDQIPRCELRAGELRDEFLRQQRLEQERYQAEQEAIARGDEELAAKLEKEAQERAAVLLQIEQEDMKLALSMSNDQPVLQTTHNSPSLSGLVQNKNTIVHSINKQIIEKIKHPEVFDLSQSPLMSTKSSFPSSSTSASRSVSVLSQDSDGWISTRSAGSSSSVPANSSSKQVDIKNHFTVTDRNDMSLFANRMLLVNNSFSQSNSTGSGVGTSTVKKSHQTVVNSGSSSSGNATSTSVSGTRDVSQYFQKRHSSPLQLSDRLSGSNVFSGSQNVAPANTSHSSSSQVLSEGIASKRPRVIEAIDLLSDESDSSLLAPPTAKNRVSRLVVKEEEEDTDASAVETVVSWFCSGCTFSNAGGTTFCRMCKADRIVL